MGDNMVYMALLSTKIAAVWWSFPAKPGVGGSLLRFLKEQSNSKFLYSIVILFYFDS